MKTGLKWWASSYYRGGQGYSPFVLEDANAEYTGFWNDDAFWNDGSTWTELEYNANYQDVLAELRRDGVDISGISEAQKTKDSLFLDAFDETLWTKVKGMKMLKADALRPDAMLTVDWKTPGSYDGSLVNTVTKDANGVYSNGSNSYMDSGIPISVVTQNSYCVFSKGIINSALGATALFGISNAGAGSSGALFINPRNASNDFGYQISSTAQQNIGSTTDATQRLCIGRSSNTVHFSSINGAARVNANDNYSPINNTSKTIFICADNGLSASNFNTRGCSYLIITDLLTDGEIATIDTALSTWLS